MAKCSTNAPVDSKYPTKTIEDPVELFQKAFRSVCNLPKSWFESRDAGRMSNFERSLKNVLAAFRAKWHPQEAKWKYLDTFSLEKWEKLDKNTKSDHSVSNCIVCSVQHNELQKAMPMRPLFEPENEENL